MAGTYGESLTYAIADAVLTMQMNSVAGDGSAIQLPPHDKGAKLQSGDPVVILAGEHRGWRGHVMQVGGYLGSGVVKVKVVTPNGRAIPVDHRREYVAKVLGTVPRFCSTDDADAWFRSQQGPIQEFATGTTVVFSCPPHMARRLGVDTNGDGVLWKDRHSDLEASGRVTKFMPWWEAAESRLSVTGKSISKNKPGYELLVLLDGEPELIEIAAYRIKRLA